VISHHLVHAFGHAALSPDPDLAVAALMIARVEYPRLDAAPYLDELDAIGREAKRRVTSAVADAGAAPPQVDPDGYARVMALNDYLFGELRFIGNDRHYEDPRNSFLNEVLERRTGIPISLALVYMEIARRAGLYVEGINFPGHFLLRCPARRGMPYTEDLIIDAHHGGALLSQDACRTLLQKYTEPEEVPGSRFQVPGSDGEDDVDDTDDELEIEAPAEMDQRLLVRAAKPQILARMLVNLKRIYVRMHSFPQARDVTDLLLAVDPSATGELRDRGLLAYHLKDFSAALRDLQAYLQLTVKAELDEDERKDYAQVWEHVKTLRRRVASLN
jgi:regulator of sirC expression with transglutaminase-like and TPR domain